MAVAFTGSLSTLFSLLYSRQSSKHVELIDFNRFIELWIEYYDKMNDEQKSILPLQPIYFLRAGES